jgi:3-hydroxyacyl-[acyl-carrier-protein] dehydratase
MSNTTHEAATDAATSTTTLDIKRLMALLPHRYPFLMIDRMIDVVPGQSATGVKNVTINEPFFTGHFPNAPVFPGVLIVEAMAQTAAALVVHTLGPASEGKLVYFMGIDNCRFRKPVGPGDTMYVHATSLKSRGAVWKFHADAKVDGHLVAEADYMAMIVDG